MRASWRMGKWRGVPIVVHWSVLLGLAWFYYQTRSVAATLVSFAAFLFLMLAHEIGHAAVAMWRGVEVGYIRLLVVHGVCAHEQPYYEEDDVLIAWGGVAAQLVVLVVAAVIGALLPAWSPDAYSAAAPALAVLTTTNLLIMVLNLIPIAPFDGAKAWRALPLLRDLARNRGWGASVRRLLAARKRAREKRLEASSQQIATDIIEKLRKGRPDARSPRRVVDAPAAREHVELVKVLVPEAEPELLAVVAMLEAHEIPCFVENAGFGSLYPGPQIGAFNTRAIMVPEHRAAEALELIEQFKAAPPA